MKIVVKKVKVNPVEIKMSSLTMHNIYPKPVAVVIPTVKPPPSPSSSSPSPPAPTFLTPPDLPIIQDINDHNNPSDVEIVREVVNVSSSNHNSSSAEDNESASEGATTMNNSEDGTSNEHSLFSEEFYRPGSVTLPDFNEYLDFEHVRGLTETIRTRERVDPARLIEESIAEDGTVNIDSNLDNNRNISTQDLEGSLNSLPSSPLTHSVFTNQTVCVTASSPPSTPLTSRQTQDIDLEETIEETITSPSAIETSLSDTEVTEMNLSNLEETETNTTFDTDESYAISNTPESAIFSSTPESDIISSTPESAIISSTPESAIISSTPESTFDTQTSDHDSDGTIDLCESESDTENFSDDYS